MGRPPGLARRALSAGDATGDECDDIGSGSRLVARRVAASSSSSWSSAPSESGDDRFPRLLPATPGCCFGADTFIPADGNIGDGRPRAGLDAPAAPDAAMAVAAAIAAAAASGGPGHWDGEPGVAEGPIFEADANFIMLS